jgi:molecular chaperone DnaK
METILGIDLGTTNSEVAIVRDDRPVILPIDGEELMPSCVGLADDGTMLVGRAAKNRMVVAPEATVLSIKRRMGEPTRVRMGREEYSPEQISSFILGKLLHSARESLGEDVYKAVITVPAYFNDAQRRATKEAGVLAGIDVVRIINEPTAASLSYEAGHEANETVMVYDLGGGTFDVSVVGIERGVVEVKASRGDTHLGGDDFDALLLDYAAERFEEHHGIDLRGDAGSRLRLLRAVERAKCALSDSPFARITEEMIYRDFSCDIEIARADYEEMIRPLLHKTIECVQGALNDASMLPGAIDKIILAGGATRTPLVGAMLREMLHKEPHSEINPDLIVAMGAAIQAAVIGGAPSNAVLVDITPHTFGTAVVGEHEGTMRPGVFVPVIRRGTALPTTKSEVFYTMVDSQEQVRVEIYQGENRLVDDNTYIGDFIVEDLSDVPAGNEIILKLNLDLDGILTVTAEEKVSGKSKSVVMDTTKAGEGERPARVKHAEVLGVDTPEGGGGKEPTAVAVHRATDLRRRAEALYGSIDPTDEEELRSLSARLQGAVASKDEHEIAELSDSLSDMLFYLED